MVEPHLMTSPAVTPRLRFAPSPTGYLHVGGARTALFNWLYARKYGGQFLLRVEDTDKARSTDESTRAIFEGLGWLGLTWDEPVVYQGANLEHHRADAQRLLENGSAYRCFCTQEELAERRAAAEAGGESFKYDRRCDRLDPAEIERRVAAGMPFTVRFRVPDGTTSWNDLVHETIAFPNKDIEDFIVLRTDGTPIYNMAVVSDDIAMRITLVMRGDDHISNTPKQILLYRALGAELPQFAHLPMIHGLDGKKLSKRHGATAVGDYQHLGILPGAMLNFLALLGWSPGNDIEVMTLDEMITLFDTSGLQKKAAIFDTKKLEWMNGQQLNLLPDDELMARVTPALVAAGLTTEEELASRRDWYIELLRLLKVRARTVDDIVRQAGTYFCEDVEFDADAVAKQWKDRAGTATILRGIRDGLAALPQWELKAMEDALRTIAEQLGYAEKAGKLFQPLRVALTGMSASPGIFEVLQLLGRRRSLARIDAALAVVEAAA
jgi:glutamyl-tRNA synthetase